MRVSSQDRDACSLQPPIIMREKTDGALHTSLRDPRSGLGHHLKEAQFPNGTIPSTSLLGPPAAAPLVTYALTDYRPHAPNHGRVAFACIIT